MDSDRPSFDDDTELLELVTAAVAVAAADTPAWVAAAGRAAFTWLSVDVELEILLAGAGRPDVSQLEPGRPQ